MAFYFPNEFSGMDTGGHGPGTAICYFASCRCILFAFVFFFFLLLRQAINMSLCFSLGVLLSFVWEDTTRRHGATVPPHSPTPTKLLTTTM